MANQIWIGNGGTVGDLNVAANWSTGSVPAAGDNLIFPAGTPLISGSLTALNDSTLGGSLGTVTFQQGYAGAVGLSSSAPFQFTCTAFSYYGSGTAFIDLEASAIAPNIQGTATAQPGYCGLYLVGSALTTLNVQGGNVGLAFAGGQTSTVAAVNVNGSATVTLGSGVSLTSATVNSGTATINCAATTITNYGGTTTTAGTGAVATINCHGGTVNSNSSGTITLGFCDGGTLSFLGSGIARTVTTLKVDPGGTVAYDPGVMTITTLSKGDYAVRLSASRP